MLIHAARSALPIIDMQERLMPAIHEGPQVVANAAWLTRIAGILGVPVYITEQYPSGLGNTVAELRELVPEDVFLEKVHFSCAAELACWDRIQEIDRDQLILLGAEAHVCVLQSALGLLQRGKEVYAVADGISSRRVRDAELGIARMRAEGVRVVSREMVAFEWLHAAGTEQFRRISRDFLR
jgi:nicotinamidase-related amidase